MDDEALLERARRGDREAFGSIVIRHQDQLYTMALRMLGRPADAADVVQETFLRAYLRLPRLRGATLRAWLFRVAVNASHDLHRRAARHPATPLEDAEGKVLELPDPAPGPEAGLLERERAQEIRQALLSVPADFRAAVILRDVNELSYAELAVALGIPVGTAKSRVARGRALLVSALAAERGQLQGEGDGAADNMAPGGVS